MNQDVIQNQIKLIGFRVANFNFTTLPNPDKKESLNKRFNLDLSNLLVADSPNHFIKAFKLELSLDSPEYDEIYELTVEYHVVFECATQVTEDFLNSSFAKISAPAIGFPYLRAFVSNFSLQAGIPTLILPSINFIQFSKELDERKKSN